MEVSPERFEELVADALDQIPPDLATRMDNVAVFIEDHSRKGPLLGLYEGVPLTERGASYGGYGEAPMPDRITVFREPIIARCSSEEEVVQQVRITVIHEVAHHFGMDDDRLAELGWA